SEDLDRRYAIRRATSPSERSHRSRWHSDVDGAKQVRPKGTTGGGARCRVTHPAAPARGTVAQMRYFVSLRIGRRPCRDAHRRYVVAAFSKNTSPKAAHDADRGRVAQVQSR